MSYLDWKVGDKVVCINNVGWTNLFPGESAPVFNGIYTIRSIVPGTRNDQIYLVLVEIQNPKLYLDRTAEARFNAKHFRPVQTRKTDISIFQRLLTNPNIRIEEDA